MDLRNLSLRRTALMSSTSSTFRPGVQNVGIPGVTSKFGAKSSNSSAYCSRRSCGHPGVKCQFGFKDHRIPSESTRKRRAVARGKGCETFTAFKKSRAVVCLAAEADRADGADEFVGWLKEQGFPDQVVNITVFEKEGLGCAAGRPLKGEQRLTEEHTGDRTGVADTPHEDGSATKAPVPLTDQTSDIGKEKNITRFGELTVTGLFILAVGALLLVDSSLPRITRSTHAPYFLTIPFLLSAAVTAVAGYIAVPLLKKIKFAQIFRKEGPAAHLVKSGTPTMGGLFFVPVGLAVAGLFNRSASVEVHGVIGMTLVYSFIGLLDDGLSLLRKHNYGLPGRIKLLLQVVAGILFYLWLKSANVSSSYIMWALKNMLPLPAPLGRLHLGEWYLVLTAFCCAAMGNGVNLTDGLDGLAGGTAAAAFIAMAVVVLPSHPALGVFGSSMAGACFGFLVHNRYKAKVFMGDTGSLALGGALAAMAACSGMFFPLLIASGVFVVETISVMGQVFYFQLTKRLYGQGRRWLRMAPFHHHLELLGFSETKIIMLAYVVGIIVSALAVYTGLLLS